MVIRLRPLAAIHRQQRELGLGAHDRVDVSHGRPAADVSVNTAAAGSRSAASRCASARSSERGVSPRTPRWLRVDREARRRSSSASGPSAQSTLRNMARADSNEAVPSSGTWSNDAASATAAQRCASVVWPVNTAIQAGEHRERRVRRDTRVAERRRSSAARSTSGPRCTWAAPRPSAIRRIGPGPSCSAGVRAPSAGDPFASYQSAARRCSFTTTSGSVRRSSPSRNSRNRAW